MEEKKNSATVVDYFGLVSSILIFLLWFYEFIKVCRGKNIKLHYVFLALTILAFIAYIIYSAVNDLIVLYVPAAITLFFIVIVLIYKIVVDIKQKKRNISFNLNTELDKLKTLLNSNNTISAYNELKTSITSIYDHFACETNFF